MPVAASLREARIAGGGGTPTPTSTVHVMTVVGQSNGKTTGIPIGATADVPNVYAWGIDSGAGSYHTITSDITPIPTPGGNTNYGPMNAYAAAYAAGMPAGDKLVIVNCAVATTSLVGGPWAVGGANYLNAIAETNLAIAACATAFPGLTVVFERIFHAQGESDAANSVTEAVYKPALNATFVGYRANITGATDCKITILAMPPPVIFNVSWTGQAINLAQIHAAVEGVGISYVPGRQGETQGDNLHWTQTGAQHMGDDAYALELETVGPAMASQPNFYTTTGRKFSHTLAVANPYTLNSGGKFATYVLGGADAAQFEIAEAYLSVPATSVWAATVVGYRLRFVGDATNSNTGTTYNITITARDGKGNLGTPQACTVTICAVGTVDPLLAIYQAGEYGHVFDPSDLSTLKQLIDGTTAVVADGDVVGWQQSKHANAAVYAALANNTTRPLYKVDADSKSFIRSDGSNDILISTTAGYGAAQKWTLIRGLRGSWVTTKYMGGENSSSSGTPYCYLGIMWTGSGQLSFQARNDASSLASGAVLASVFDGSTKQVVTTVFEGVKTTGTQRRAKARLGSSRGAGGDGTGYTTANLSFSGAITTNRSSRFGTYGSGSPGNYSGFDAYYEVGVAKELEDYEIANMEDRVAAQCLTTTLP